MFDLKELGYLVDSINIKIDEIEWLINNHGDSHLTGSRIEKLKDLRELRKKLNKKIKEIDINN